MTTAITTNASITILGAEYNLKNLRLAMGRGTDSFIEPGSKFHELPAELVSELSVGQTRFIVNGQPVEYKIPVVTLHDKKYIHLGGVITPEMLAKGFRAKFVSKYSLNQARAKPAAVQPVSIPDQVKKLQDKYTAPPPRLWRN